MVDKYKITFESWNKVAALYQEKFMDVELYNDTYDLFCSLLNKPDADILEIGCGPGNITRYLLRKMPDLKILCTDIAPNMLELAKINNPSAEFMVLDSREIHTLNKKYDAIVCGFCMPYLSKNDCKKLISDCAWVLKPGGIFYFSTMEDDYSKSGFKTGSDGVTRMYMYFHEERYLRDYLASENFKALHLMRKKCPNPDGSFATDMIFISEKI